MLTDLDQELKVSLQYRAAEISGQGHLSLELLISYHAGELTEEKERDIRSHLVWCRECTALLLGLNDFVEAGAAVPATDAEAPWKSLQSRFPRKHHSEPTSPSLGLSRVFFSRRLLFGVAASLFVATVALSTWVANLRHAVGELSEPQINVVIRDLYLSDSSRDPGGAGFNEVTAGAGVVTLILNSSESRQYPDYLMTIENATGVELWRRRGVKRSSWNTFTLALSGRFLPPGNYRIRLYGLEENHWTPIEEYPLRVLSD